MSTEPRVFLGRKRIYTDIDVDKASIEEIAIVVCSAYKDHALENRFDMTYLIDYYLGKHQPILDRTKEVKPEITTRLIMNLQKAIVRDTTGYFMGTPVQYIAQSSEKAGEVKKLSDAMKFENQHTVDIEVENDCAIVGVGYKGVFFDSDPINEVPFQLMSLSPLNTFCVYGTNIGDKAIMAVTYNTYKDINNNVWFNIIAYTKDKIYTFRTQTPEGLKAEHLLGVTANVIGIIPIVEYRNNKWFKGDIEDVLSIIDAIDLLDSNNMDSVEEVVQSILAIFGVSKEQQEAIDDVPPNALLMFTGENGINQDAKYLNPVMNVEAITTFREHLEESMRVIAGVPDRKTRGGGGGDTGDAVKLRDGWADMELVARDKECYWRESELQIVRLALRMLEIGSDKLNITPKDVDIKFTRNKTDNLQSKAQAGATLHNMGLAHTDVLALMEITNDIEEMAQRWTANQDTIDQKQMIQASITNPMNNKQNNPDE